MNYVLCIHVYWEKSLRLVFSSSRVVTWSVCICICVCVLHLCLVFVFVFVFVFAFVFSICIFVFSRKEFPPAVGRPPLQPRKTAASCNSTSLTSTLNMKNQPMPPTMISSQKSSSSWRRTDIKKVFKQCVGGLKYVCWSQTQHNISVPELRVGMACAGHGRSIFLTKILNWSGLPFLHVKHCIPKNQHEGRPHVSD